MKRILFFIAAIFIGQLAAADEVELPLIGIFKPTFYWGALETNDGTPRNTNILGMDDSIIATVSAAYFRSLTMEGTGRLLDGRVLNFGKRVTMPDGTSEIRYRICGSDYPYGYGYEFRPLVPFRSIAVDPNEIPLDSVVYIPEARGAILPDGQVHDGLFKAVDIGGAILGKRFDVFTGFGDHQDVFEKIGLINMKPAHIYLVSPKSL